MKILVGADPEVFMKNAAGKFVSAWGKIPGTKREPYLVNKGAVQVDGNALEFNIDPAETKEAFIGNIQEVYEKLKEMVPGFNLAIEPVAVFDREYFESLPEEARALGCDPDFNAWERVVNERPDINEPLRAAGGHIHLGWLDKKDYADIHDPNHFEDCILVAKQMDYYLGMWSLLWDKDVKRRALYGKAGCFRPKPYGVEYRTLSNVWLKDEALMGWVYDAATKGMKDLDNGLVAAETMGDFAESTINNNNYTWRRGNQSILIRLGLEFPKHLEAAA